MAEGNTDAVGSSPRGVRQQPLSRWRTTAVRLGARARYLSWCVRAPRLVGDPPFRIGRRARISLVGTGRIHRQAGVVIEEDCTCIVQATLTLGRNVYINRGAYISAFAGVDIGDHTIIGERVSIHDENHDRVGGDDVAGYRAAPISIGRHVWLGANVVVLAGVHIGDDTVVGAGSIVTHDLPAGVLAVGAPARPVRPIAEGRAP